MVKWLRIDFGSILYSSGATRHILFTSSSIKLEKKKTRANPSPFTFPNHATRTGHHWSPPFRPSPGPYLTVCAPPPTAPPRRDGERRPGAEAGVRGLRLPIGPLRHRVQAHHALQLMRQENGALPRSVPRLLRSHHQPNPGMDPSVPACPWSPFMRALSI
jgi:hypothetical protein